MLQKYYKKAKQGSWSIKYINKNQRFSNVFRGYGNGTLEDGLK